MIINVYVINLHKSHNTVSAMNYENLQTHLLYLLYTSKKNISAEFMLTLKFLKKYQSEAIGR